jgi:3-methylcrotonyl-CoA carboxylase alpha subunit
MIKKLLIANRGEIACRIIRSARALGIRTVAVYSEADADAMHVKMADSARLLGPAPAAQSYLVIEKIIEAAKSEGAEAIHPGYGFLSERAAFADACAEAGLIFVGPSADAIRAMGDKARAKALMGKAGVPLTPGYHGEDQSDDLMTAEAAKIGFPVLVKASAGGGGRGMRIVEAADELQGAMDAARREAKAAFGDDTLLLERYLGRPRHVEVQVMADSHGNVLHLHERDCSIQRRHQKVIEEAPAPNLSDATRKQLTDAAVAAARAIDYVGAGTCEFLVDEDGSPYFIEMNTRIQVEHPVTEMITGLDLIELQLRVAGGEALPLTQDEVQCRGSAIEARLYAEDPARGFLPQTGTLTAFDVPDNAGRVRVDTGVQAGDAISMHYDPMIAKVVAWAETRDLAAHELTSALAGTAIAGVTTNIGFLADTLRHPAFLAVELDTHFIERHEADLLGGPEAPSMEAIAAAVALLLEEQAATARALSADDPSSPWAENDGFRLNQNLSELFRFQSDAEPIDVTLTWERGGRSLECNGQSAPFAYTPPETEDGIWTISLGDRTVQARIARAGQDIIAGADGRRWRLTPLSLGAEAGADAGPGSLASPMPGKIIRVEVEAGAKVKKGDPLVALEAMKMEHVITAPADGVVESLNCALGDQVEEGVALVVIDAA